MPLRNWITGLSLLIGSQANNALGATIGEVTAGFELDGFTQEWANKPPFLSMIQKGAGARPGQIWLAQSPEGLVVAGNIGGPPPMFAKTAKDMPNGDHVELWVAIADKVALPPIGAYSTMDVVTELHSVADCKEDAECKAWFASQEAHRRLLPRLFVRQWQLAPGVAVETYARPALEGMRKESRETYQYLSPKGLPEAKFTAKPTNGYEFEALIPWEALPPSDRLNLDKLRLMVDVFSPGDHGKYGKFSTTSVSRRYGVVKTLNTVALTPPRRWRLSPCDYPLVGKNFWGRVGSNALSKSLPAYFLPNGRDEATALFVLDNDWICRHCNPTGISPVIGEIEFFSQQLSPALTICGPDLAVRRGNQISYGKNLDIEPNPKVKKVPGGWLVVGTWNGTFRDPEGQCGACEEKSLNLHFLPDTGGPPKSAFKIYGDEPECCGVGAGIEEITLFDDYQRIRVKEILNDKDVREKTTEYCFDSGKHVFLECPPENDNKPAKQPSQTQPAIPPATQESEAAVRAQLSESLAMAESIKPAVIEYFLNRGRFPADNAAAGIAKPEQIIGNYVPAIRVEQGAIHIQFGNRVDRSIAGKWLSLRPAMNYDNPCGPLSWWCGYAP